MTYMQIGAGMDGEKAPAGPFAPRRTPDPADRRDFFISWERTEARNAQWVAETLTGAGYRCYFYPWDNLAGDNYQRRMTDEDALSTHVLCVFSHGYFALRDDGRRSHAYGEAISAFDHDSGQEKRRLLWVSFEPWIDAVDRFRTIVGLPLYNKSEEEQREALLAYAHSAVHGTSFGYTPLTVTPDEVVLYDRTLRPWAAWLPSGWDPCGAEPLPAVADRSLRVDALWVRDRSPFRAVLADWPGADLRASLDRGEGRAWHHLGSLAGRAGGYADRAAVLAALRPPPTTDGPLGVVTGLRLTADVPLKDAVDRAAAGFVRLVELLPDDALVLRLEGGASEQAIWTAAAVAWRLRGAGPPLDVATRLRPGDRAQPRAGGVTGDVLAIVLTRLRSRRQELGATVGWAATGDDGAARLGPDSADALVREFEGGAALPTGVTEPKLLRHIRDLLPELWAPLVRRYATDRSEPAWSSALAIASEWPADLAGWVDAAAAAPHDLLNRPDLILSRLDDNVADRVLLALRNRPQTHRRWLSASGTPLANALRSGSTLDELPADAVRRALRAELPVSTAAPRTDAFWVALSMSTTADPASVRSAGIGVDVDQVLAWGGADATPDPVAARLLDYYRTLVRPIGTS